MWILYFPRDNGLRYRACTGVRYALAGHIQPPFFELWWITYRNRTLPTKARRILSSAAPQRTLHSYYGRPRGRDKCDPVDPRIKCRAVSESVEGWQTRQPTDAPFLHPKYRKHQVRLPGGGPVPPLEISHPDQRGSQGQNGEKPQAKSDAAKPKCQAAEPQEMSRPPVEYTG